MASEDRGWVRTLWDEASFWSTWFFGTLISAVGLVSFFQHVFDVPLIPDYAHGLAAYRLWVHTFMGWLYWPFVSLAQFASLSWFHVPIKIVVPAWLRDLAAISTVSVVAIKRAENFLLVDRNRLPPEPIWRQLRRLVARVVAGITLWGFVLAYRTIRPLWRSPRTADIPNVLGPEYTASQKAIFTEAARRALTKVQTRLAQGFLLSIAGMGLACIVFFVTNAYSP